MYEYKYTDLATGNVKYLASLHEREKKLHLHQHSCPRPQPASGRGAVGGSGRWADSAQTQV